MVSERTLDADSGDAAGQAGKLMSVERVDRCWIHDPVLREDCIGQGPGAEEHQSGPETPAQRRFGTEGAGAARVPIIGPSADFVVRHDRVVRVRRVGRDVERKPAGASAHARFHGHAALRIEVGIEAAGAIGPIGEFGRRRRLEYRGDIDPA